MIQKQQQRKRSGKSYQSLKKQGPWSKGGRFTAVLSVIYHHRINSGTSICLRAISSFVRTSRWPKKTYYIDNSTFPPVG